MKSNYLFIQIDIGQGTQWGNQKTINPIRDIFIPSVKEYCNKFNYDYYLITDSVYEKKYINFDFLETKNKHFSFERYFHFNNNYNYTIYIDNDVYIYPNAKPLPKIKGLMNVREPEGNSSKIFRAVHNLSEDCGYFNSGVTFCDKEIATKLSKYMINRLENKSRSKGKNSDNMLLNEFILENKKHFNELGCEWNYSPFLPNSKKTNDPNFFHFVGIHGKNIINKLQDSNIDILKFLYEIKNIS
tara:strand:- start:3198 stop:3926 length:729 start_codon:yes stop_codon:yes gene_type:complete